MFLTLILACLTLFLGPLLYEFLGIRRGGLQVIDGFVFVAISGLLLASLFGGLEHLPEGLGVALMAVGLFGPLLLERVFERAGSQVHIATLLFGATGFLIHSAIDGAALAANTFDPRLAHDGYSSIALAVIVHQLPVGLTVWWLFKPRFGFASALFALGIAILATVVGFIFAESLLPVHHSHQASTLGEGFSSADFLISLIEPLVVGSILHVVLFRFHLHSHSHGVHHHESEPHEHSFESHAAPNQVQEMLHSRISFEGFGNLLGLLFLSALLCSFPPQHGEGESPFWGHFMALTYESAPALLLAYVAGIFIYGFFPESSLQWMRKGGRIGQAAKGMLVGLPLPICSCGVLPYYQTLVKRGAPPAAAVAFLIATPELGVDAIILSLPLLGGKLTLIRLIASAVIAFVVALLMSRFLKARRSLPVLGQELPSDVKSRLRRGTQFALVELLDTTAPWMIVGLLLAAFAEPLVRNFDFTGMPVLEVFLFSGLGLVVYVCASGATPLVAALIAAGVSPGAGLSFLIAGPATNISTFGVLAELHGRKIALLFATLMLGAATLAGLITNVMLPDYVVGLVAALHDHAHLSVALWRKLSAVLLFALFLSSLVRQGGRRFFGHVVGNQFGA